MRLTLSLLLYEAICLIPIYATEVEYNMNPTFEKGRSRYRTEILNYNTIQMQSFCARIQFFLNNYQDRWDILEQLTIDMDICTSNGMTTSDDPVLTSNKSPPKIKITGILPFEFHSSTNRSSAIEAMDSYSILTHCEQVGEFILQYLAEWNCWEQLALDYSYCLKNDLYKLIDGDNVMANITSKLRTENKNDINFIANDIAFIHNGYISRSILEDSSDLYLNFFCNRILYLNDQINAAWEIESQLQMDMIAAWAITSTRPKFIRVDFAVPKLPPVIKVMGKLPFSTDKGRRRKKQLKNLGSEKLLQHCRTASELLQTYNVFWKTFDQMSNDINYCSVLALGPEISNTAFKKLPTQLYKMSLRDTISTCITVGNLIQESWRLEDINGIVKSLKTCFWKLAENVLCVPSSSNGITFEDDAESLKAETEYVAWDKFKTYNSTMAMKFCMLQITKIHHLFITSQDDRIFTNNMAICIHMFKNLHEKNNGEQYYIADRSIVSVSENILPCKNSLSTVLTIIFPNSGIAKAYEQREQNNTSNIFRLAWQHRRNRKYYFTEDCNTDIENQPLCNDLNTVYSNKSLETFCSRARSDFHRVDVSKHLLVKKLTKLQNCFKFSLCPSLICTNVINDEVFNATKRNKCLQLVKSVIDTNWNTANKTNLLLTTIGMIDCFDFETFQIYPFADYHFTHLNKIVYHGTRQNIGEIITTLSLESTPNPIHEAETFVSPTQINQLSNRKTSADPQSSFNIQYTPSPEVHIGGQTKTKNEKSTPGYPTANPSKHDLSDHTVEKSQDTPKNPDIQKLPSYVTSTPISDLSYPVTEHVFVKTDFFLSTETPAKETVSSINQKPTNNSTSRSIVHFIRDIYNVVVKFQNISNTKTELNNSSNSTTKDVFPIENTTDHIGFDTEILRTSSNSVREYTETTTSEPIVFEKASDKNIIDFVAAAGVIVGLGPALADIVGTIPAVGLVALNPNIREISNSNDRNRIDDDQEDLDYDDESDEESEEVSTTESSVSTTMSATEKQITTDKSSTTEEATSKETTTETSTTEESTTTEDPTTTEEPLNPLCWIDPPYDDGFQNHLDMGRRKRQSPPRQQRIMAESQYPSFPLGLCRLVINELNSYHVERDSFEFIEFAKTCKPKGQQSSISARNLKHYLVLIIDGKTMSIVFGATLHNAKSIKSGKNIYITIGPNNRDGVSLPFGDPNVHIVHRTTTDVIPNRNEVANMLILLHIQSFSNHKHLLPKDGKPIKVDDLISKIITVHRQDCIVYGSSASKDKCGLFETICPELRLRDLDYFLRDWESENGVFKDFSLSRCAQHIWPFDSWSFKLTTPTPGKENDCPNGVRFVLSENQQILPLRLEGSASDLQIDDPVPQCSSTLPKTQIDALGAVTFKEAVIEKQQDTTRTCTQGDLQSSRLSSQINTLQSFDNLIMTMKEKEKFWHESGCRKDIKVHLETYMPKYVNSKVCDDPKIGWWIDLAPSEDQSTRKLFCKICTEFYKDYTTRSPSALKMTKLMNPEGYLDTSDQAKTRNGNVLYAHSLTLNHLDAVDYVREKVVNKKIEHMEKVMRSNIPPRDRITRPTELLFQQAMFNIIHGYPDRHFQDELEYNRKMYFVDFGNRYVDYKGQNKIVKSVAEDYLIELLHEINKQNPIAIMLDTYKDFSGRNMIGVSLMMYYKNKIQNKFFCLLELGSDHTNVVQYATIMNFIRQVPIPIEESFKLSLAYFSADGAAVNSGDFNSIKIRLQELTGRKINYFHCSSHRLHLVFTKILKSARFLQASAVIKSAESIYNFFSTQTNRRERLVEIQKRDNKKPVTPHRPHPIRWADSMRQAFQRIYAMFDTLVEGLEESKKDKTISVRTKADNMLELMTTRDYVLWLSFLCDVMDVFAAFSKITQQKTAVLLEQLDLARSLKRDIAMLDQQKGTTMTLLLKDITCNKPAEKECSIENFEKHGATFKNVKLVGIGTNLADTKLSRHRTIYIRMILDEIEVKFPNKYNMYDIFMPRNLFIPQDLNTQYKEGAEKNLPPPYFHYGTIQFEQVVADVGKTYDSNLYNAWRNVIWAIVTNSEFPKMRDMSPVAFWLAMLDKPQLPWTDDLKWIVKAVLIVPVSSAEVERIFSSVTYLLGKYRFRTSMKHLNDILRLRSELPRPITEWKPYSHVMKFVDRKNLLSESSLPLESSKVKRQRTSGIYDDLADFELNDDEDIVCEDPDDCFWKSAF